MIETLSFKKLLFRKYVLEKKTDREIAEELGVDRTTITHARKYHDISTRENTGSIGESIVKEELKVKGFNVLDMNQLTKTFPFDLLVENYIRVEIKSSTITNDRGFQKFTFSLSEKEDNQNIESPYRIKLSNKRTRKLYRKTCDFLILCGLADTNNFFIIPSQDIPDLQVTISIPYSNPSNSKYEKYRNNWELLRR